MPFHFRFAAVPWAVMCVVLVTLASVILQRQRASRVARLFCLMIFLVAGWFLGFAAMFSTTSASLAAMFGRLAIASVAFLPAAVYDFTATSIRSYVRHRAIVLSAWFAAALFAVLILATDVILDGTRQFPWGSYPRAGRGSPIFFLYFFAVLAMQMFAYADEYRRTHDERRRRRILNLIASFAIVYLSVVDFIPMTGVDHRPIGYVPVFAFVAFAWRSIRSHRFQNITAARAAGEILDTMADALFVIDAEARVRITNEAVRKLFGYAESEILGKTIDALEYVDPEASFSRTLGDMLRRAPIRDEERVFRTKNGERIDVSISVSSLHEREVEGGAVVIVRDIRERKLVEQEMRDFTIQLQQSNRELEDFAYVASHDLQEPLRKIQAFGDRLKVKYAETLVGDGIDYLDRMQKAAGRMQALINDLLVFSRITTKAQPFAAVDLQEIAHEVVHDLEVRIHQAGGEVIVGALPAIDADALQMHQLLQNLVGNGLKFHRPDLPPRVEISGRVFNNTAQITVSDNGIGFDEKYADRIFTMFERLHGRAAYEGTGIGLAICRKIAHRHGGEIQASSVPGEGARFVVTLPVRHKVD
ncbi:MAG TPA: ATP-binding protein [Thermoanaerobaculia bacterium]